ncbi:hypothetical protein [Xanthomonas sp. XNM01]|uniref:hypothetical protein n=1 Tax=Xanthomonas sp. XNM01 TaxID=2769289 RepID=UPI00177BE497|nr:hypothetical protein [Xanthomonas sp. XNM01]MBD9370431.1 hypothetical protein [Xanthomonas sp. XNM01]
MQVAMQPFGPAVDWFHGSAIVEVHHGVSGLRIVAAAPHGVDRYLEVHFAFANAFQVMDEGDMLDYWAPPYRPDGHLVHEVLEGGWRPRVQGRLLSITGAHDGLREWLVSTVDLCVSVIAAEAPHVREYG